MKIQNPPQGTDLLRYRRLYPVETVRSVSIDGDHNIEIAFDCLDDGPQDSIPGFENQPTKAVMGLMPITARHLSDQLRAILGDINE